MQHIARFYHVEDGLTTTLCRTLANWQEAAKYRFHEVAIRESRDAGIFFLLVTPLAHSRSTFETVTCYSRTLYG